MAGNIQSSDYAHYVVLAITDLVLVTESKNLLYEVDENSAEETLTPYELQYM